MDIFAAVWAPAKFSSRDRAELSILAAFAVLGQQARYAAPLRRHGSGLNFLFCLDWAGGVFAGWALLCLWIGLLPHVVFVAVRETGERRFQEPRRASSARARVARGAAERCRPSPSRAHSIKSTSTGLGTYGAWSPGGSAAAAYGDHTRVPEKIRIIYQRTCCMEDGGAEIAMLNLQSTVSF